MRGGSQPHLVRADDGQCYIIKALNNPQHPRVLANEWIASGIAVALGLSIPPIAIVDLTPEFIRTSPDLVLHCRGARIPLVPGPAFGSRVPGSSIAGAVVDYLPEGSLALVENIDEFVGAMVFDKWICNCDSRQVIFCRPDARARIRAYFIDHGFAFNAGEWSFPDCPLGGVYSRNCVYRGVRGWNDLEPWLARIEQFTPNQLEAIVGAMPDAWRDPGIEELMEQLHRRRKIVRRLVDDVRRSARQPFTEWGNPTDGLPRARAQAAA
jgi:hypothetical protein